MDVNNRGQVVGEYWEDTNPYSNSSPFLWQDGQAVELPPVGDMGNAATHINDRGQVIIDSRGGFLPDNGVVGTPVLWEDGNTIPIADGDPVDLNENGEVLVTGQVSGGRGAARIWRDGRITATVLPPDGGNYINPTDLSETGSIAGEARYTMYLIDVPLTIWRDPVVWQDGSLTRFELDSDYVAFRVNRSGQAILRVPTGTGPVQRPEDPLGLLADDGDTTDLGIAPYDINDRGQVVGEKDGRAYLWEDGQLAELDSLGGGSRAFGINEHGQVIGQSYTADGELHGVVWSSGHVVDLGPAELTDINDRGQVIGRVIDPASDDHVTAALWQVHDDSIDN